MFRINQMITATELFKYFKLVIDEAYHSNEPILVMQRSGQHIVLMVPEFFEDLVARGSMSADKIEVEPGIRQRIQTRETGI